MMAAAPVVREELLAHISSSELEPVLGISYERALVRSSASATFDERGEVIVDRREAGAHRVDLEVVAPVLRHRST